MGSSVGSTATNEPTRDSTRTGVSRKRMSGVLPAGPARQTFSQKANRPPASPPSRETSARNNRLHRGSRLGRSRLRLGCSHQHAQMLLDLLEELHVKVAHGHFVKLVRGHVLVDLAGPVLGQAARFDE